MTEIGVMSQGRFADRGIQRRAGKVLRQRTAWGNRGGSSASIAATKPAPFHDGRRIRMLNIIDEFTHECLAIRVSATTTPSMGADRGGTCPGIMP